jgi:hypothetical protein
MRRTHPIAVLGALIGALTLTAACSRSDGHNADVRKAEAEVRRAGHDAAQDLRKLGAAAKVETHKLAGDTRNAGHDVTRDDHSNDKSS